MRIIRSVEKMRSPRRSFPWLSSLLLATLLLCCMVNSLAAQPLTIKFARGSADVSAQDMTRLKTFARQLEGLPLSRVRVEGFSDATPIGSVNPFSDNQALSQARAEQVAALLQQQSGQTAELFVAIGRGVRSGSGAAGRRVDVRVELQGGKEFDPGVTAEQPRVTLQLNDISIAEAVAMLSRKERVNILLSKEVEGNVSLNLYQVTLKEALQALAKASGYELSPWNDGFIIHPKDESKKLEVAPDTQMRAFKVQYSPPAQVEQILAKHLSEHGKITVLTDRNLLVVEDLPASVARLELLLKEIDQMPRQILIEAKILEITLDDTETFGLDWSRLFDSDGGTGSVGIQGFANTDSFTGLVASLQDAERVNFILNMLSDNGRVHTLSTPKLLALENQESSVIIGDRQGFKVTTTINQITTESIEFLESGVILRVTPSVDGQERILMRIHPEVSTGTIQNGIPSQNTTEVDTDLLAASGQTIFVGGLIKKSTNFNRRGVPLLGDIPLLGRLFSSSKEIEVTTETIALITPYLVDQDPGPLQEDALNKVSEAEKRITRKRHVHAELPELPEVLPKK